MKIRVPILAAFAVLIAQVGVGYAIRLSTQVMAYHWHELLDGKALPPLTTMTLRFGMAVPIAAALLTVAGVAIPVLRSRVHWWLLGVVLLEAIVLAGFMIGLAAPSICVTYQFGK
jgi:hypothetical protein